MGGLKQGKYKPNSQVYFFFAIRLVNLQLVTGYRDQNFKSKCSFCSSKNIEDLDVDFILQHFNLWCMFCEQSQWRNWNRNLVEEEDSSELLENFLAVHSQEGENWLSEIRDIFPKRKRAIPLTNMITNMPTLDHLDKLLAICSLFFQRPTKERWKWLQARHNVQFTKDSSITLGKRITNNNLTFDWINFFNMGHLQLSP